MAGVADAVSTMVCHRCADTLSEVVRPWGSVDIDTLTLASPWRTFRWYKLRTAACGISLLLAAVTLRLLGPSGSHRHGPARPARDDSE